jgi:solute carrier family 10 (sodium/bile acid cotransporter), member 7
VGRHRRPSGRGSRSVVAGVLGKLRIDGYIVALLGTVALASVLPVRGQAATATGHVATVAVGLLFFLYGARLSMAEAVEGMRQWRLHTLVLGATFVLFPLLGLAARPLVGLVLSPQLYAGVVFLCCLPSTVQSSIAFTSMARGNVAAAICSASFSNLLGIVVTPALAAALLATKLGGHTSVLGPLGDIVGQLLLPFLAGQLLRRWIGGFITRHKKVLGLVDRGSILLVVYTAFSEGVVSGIWHTLRPADLGLLLGVDAVLLAVVLCTTTALARKLRFRRAEEIVIVFCGSKKSLASGIPMATVLFPAATIGLTVLPLMLFHQIQLMTCAWLARRYATTTPPTATPDTSAAATVHHRPHSVAENHRSAPVPAPGAETNRRRIGQFNSTAPRVPDRPRVTSLPTNHTPRQTGVHSEHRPVPAGVIPERPVAERVVPGEAAAGHRAVLGDEDSRYHAR